MRVNPERRLGLVAAWTAVILLTLLCWLVVTQGYPSLNQSLFLLINRLGGHAQWFWQNLTVLGEGLVAFVLVACCAGRRGRLIWLALLAALIAGLASQGLKHFFDMARPAALLAPDSFHIIGATLRSHAFPSGHATTALVAASVLAARLPRLGVPLYLAAALIALSRVVVGAHWPMDVLAGACVGYLSGLAALEIARYWSPEYRVWQGVTAWIVLLGLSVWLVLFESDYPQARALTVLVGLYAVALSLYRLIFLLRRA